MKTAWVLCGGGSRGAYEIGVWQALSAARPGPGHRDGNFDRRVKRRVDRPAGLCGGAGSVGESQD